MAERTCSIEDCDRPLRARGWCSTHWRRWSVHGDPSIVLPAGRKTVVEFCAVEDCGQPHKARGLCDKHYQRWSKHGDPDIALRMPKGEGNHRWKGASIKYQAAHRRVRAVRGSASEHLCVDCGESAKEWSYRRGAGTPLIDSRTGAPYSPDPSDYEPRCKSCHNIYDRKAKSVD